MDILSLLSPSSSGLQTLLSSNHPSLNSTFTSAFLRSSSSGDVETLSFLLSPPAIKYVDLNAVDSDGTPALILATAFGHNEALKLLVESGVTIDQVDRGISFAYQ